MATIGLAGWIRWLLIVPVCILGWYLVFTLGFALLGVLLKMCPEEHITSGTCGAPWYANAKDALIIALAGLSAFIVVFIAYMLAPSHKTKVALITFLLGAAAATYVVVDTGSWIEYIAAITSGLLATMIIFKRNKKIPA